MKRTRLLLLATVATTGASVLVTVLVKAAGTTVQAILEGDGSTYP